ncbi:hypothetical protein LJB42_001565 [Komagataella kurtzmanii]|nr:hypothetical protein LJB42_001565 [Komagataella kurtzmanii]
MNDFPLDVLKSHRSDCSMNADSFHKNDGVVARVHSLSSTDLQYPTLAIINNETGEETVVTKDWTDEEEQRLVRKLDCIVIPILFFAFFLLQLDRGNISNAYTDTSLTNMLQLDNTRINIASALFSSGIVIFEVPFNIALQRLSPSVFLSSQILIWGIIATIQYRMDNLRSFYVLRFVLGAAEAGFIPGGLYYLSTWYKKSELGLRHTFYYFGNLTASALSGLIAAWILDRLPGYGGLEGWQWIFLIEGIASVGYAIVFLLLLPESAQHPAAFWNHRWFYFNERERSILRQRVILDEPSKIISTEKTSYKDVKNTLKNPVLWLHLMITVSSLQTGSALSSYIPLIIESFGFTVFEANAKSSIPKWCSMILMLILTYTSKHFKPKGASILFALLWQLVSQIMLRELPADATPNQRFTALCFLITAGISGHVLNCSWMSMNFRNPRERSIAFAVLIMAANIGGVTGGQILRNNDKPLYRKGFLALIMLDVFSILAVVVAMGFYFYMNRKADQLYGKLSSIDLEGENDNDSNSYLGRTVHVGFAAGDLEEEDIKSTSIAFRYTL